SDGSVIVCRLRRGPFHRPAQIPDALSDGPGCEEQHRCRERSEEGSPPAPPSRSRDSPLQQRGKQRADRQQEPPPRVGFLNEPLPRVIPAVPIAVGTES